MIATSEGNGARTGTDPLTAGDHRVGATAHGVRTGPGVSGHSRSPRQRADPGTIPTPAGHSRCPDIFTAVPTCGRRLVDTPLAFHHGSVTTTATPADRVLSPGRSQADPAVSWHLVAHLERFWPSRRLDAFDEFCRAR